MSATLILMLSAAGLLVLLLVWVRYRRRSNPFRHLPAKFQGTVVSVSDGDGFRIRPDGYEGSVRIRLLGIDAPETAQAYGDKAKAALRQKLQRKQASVTTVAMDKYDRRVSLVTVDGRDIGLSQIEDGMAWACVNRRNIPADIAKRYTRAQEAAGKKRLGLWRDPAPLEPRVWRKENAGWDGDRPVPSESVRQKHSLPVRLILWLLRFLGLR